MTVQKRKLSSKYHMPYSNQVYRYLQISNTSSYLPDVYARNYEIKGKNHIIVVSQELKEKSGNLD